MAWVVLLHGIGKKQVGLKADRINPAIAIRKQEIPKEPKTDTDAHTSEDRLSPVFLIHDGLPKVDEQRAAAIVFETGDAKARKPNNFITLTEQGDVVVFLHPLHKVNHGNRYNTVGKGPIGFLW